jgi:hypothetical protein
VSYVLTFLVKYWFCADVSFDQRYVYVGGAYSDVAVIGVIKFDKTLKNINFLKLSFDEFRSITTIKRIPGTDIILAGAWCSILALSFDFEMKIFKILNIF